MKVGYWLRKLSIALVAGGIITSASARAADFNVNLVVNGDFESVDLSTTGGENGPRILGWTGPNMYAYSHNGRSSIAGVVPDLADGPDPPNPGSWYFSTNNTGTDSPPDIRDRDVFFQDIDVSTGPVAITIANGRAYYTVSAYFSSYQNESDFGTVLVEYLNSTGAVIFHDNNSDQDNGPGNVWSPMKTSLNILPATKTIRVSLYGVPDAAGVRPGVDGYIDNVSLVISRTIPEPSGVVLAGLGVPIALGLPRRLRPSCQA